MPIINSTPLYNILSATLYMSQFTIPQSQSHPLSTHTNHRPTDQSSHPPKARSHVSPFPALAACAGLSVPLISFVEIGGIRGGSTRACAPRARPAYRATLCWAQAVEIILSFVTSIIIESRHLDKYYIIWRNWSRMWGSKIIPVLSFI